MSNSTSLIRSIDQRLFEIDAEIRDLNAQRKSAMSFRSTLPGGTGPVKKRRALRKPVKTNGTPPATAKRRGRPPKAAKE